MDTSFYYFITIPYRLQMLFQGPGSLSIILCPGLFFSNPYSYAIDPDGSTIALTGLIYFITLLLYYYP